MKLPLLLLHIVAHLQMCWLDVSRQLWLNALRNGRVFPAVRMDNQPFRLTKLSDFTPSIQKPRQLLMRSSFRVVQLKFKRRKV